MNPIRLLAVLSFLAVLPGRAMGVGLPESGAGGYPPVYYDLHRNRSTQASKSRGLEMVLRPERRGDDLLLRVEVWNLSRDVRAVPPLNTPSLLDIECRDTRGQPVSYEHDPRVHRSIRLLYEAEFVKLDPENALTRYYALSGFYNTSAAQQAREVRVIMGRTYRPGSKGKRSGQSRFFELKSDWTSLPSAVKTK